VINGIFFAIIVAIFIESIFRERGAQLDKKERSLYARAK